MLKVDLRTSVEVLSPFFNEVWESNVFCRVILNRIRMAVDQRIREEIAGFRSGRCCSDQIFAMRYIVEQCIEWNAPETLHAKACCSGLLPVE